MADTAEDREDETRRTVPRFPAPPRRSRRAREAAAADDKPKRRVVHRRKRDEFEVELMRLLKLRRMLNR